MGINVELQRVQPGTVGVAASGRAWPRPEMREGESFRATLSLDKAWGVLRWLLHAAACPVDPVLGTPLPEAKDEGGTRDEAKDEDDGLDPDLAPPGLLTPEEVARAAAFLAALSFDTLADFTDEDAMDLDDVYPQGLDRAGVEGLRGYYTDLQAFYAAAALAGQAVLRELG
ncbi:DUF1877 family protein [Streptacidiphilus jiangxiensis]|uniref:DUF1877 domain-containing protein n=1 Tax=Streptacidiphilus jiangxiensis TaxID=235985 RepID=A0A1H7N7Q2_STRJI|nr:DUF1877 family protein [Streptacidiphilus jiangxiensis]SEL19622.1 protein of unknown function [Streptacidiphilus jiangxiensis]